jgi:hypothetical protein
VRVLLATVAAYTGFGLLLIAGVAHAGSPGTFRRLVARQAVWPSALVTPVAVAVLVAELAVGVAGIVATLTHEGTAARAATLRAAALLYLAMALYGAFLRARRPGAPCACSQRDHPADGWVPVRALVLAAGCGYAAGNAEQVLGWSSTAEFLVAVLASACFLVLAWSAPDALHHPDDDPRPPRARQELRWISRPAR